MTDDSLFSEPKKADEFRTESPLRAFAEYTEFGGWLIAKGFRPSLHHLVRYLAAMESREGYKLVQILEADTAVPTMIFRTTARAVLDDVTAVFKVAEIQRGNAEIDRRPYVADFWSDDREEPWKLVVKFRDKQAIFFRGDVVDHEEPTTERNPGAEEATAKIDETQAASDMMGKTIGVWYVGPHNLESMNQEDYSGCDELHIMLQGIDADSFRPKGFFFHDFDASGRAVYWKEVTSVISDEIAPDRQAFNEAIFKDAPVVPAMTADAGPLERPLSLGHWTDRGSDIDIPKEFREECARYVLTRLEKPEYLEKSVRGFKRSFLNPKARSISHTTMAQQLIFHTGRHHSHTVKQCIDNFRASKQSIRLKEEISDKSIPIMPKTELRLFDDANPAHYNGWECGDIGERLSPNGYQILKYCWRLGKKDDPCKELGKALRYLDREVDYLKVAFFDHTLVPNFTGIEVGKRLDYLLDRTANQSQFTADVARFLWNGYNWSDLEKLKAMIADHKARLDCGHGLAI